MQCVYSHAETSINRCVKIIGGFYPEDTVITEQSLYKSPNVADFGVIIIENSNKKKCSDCAVIGQISLLKEAIDFFSKQESKVINKMIHSKRQ